MSNVEYLRDTSTSQQSESILKFETPSGIETERRLAKQSLHNLADFWNHIGK